MSVRQPAVAGMFYPADPDELRAGVLDLLAAADATDPGFVPRFLIVPHAGYVYSGPIAATGYRLLKETPPVRRVVMLGPSHFVPCRGLALPGVDELHTPLGNVTVDTAGAGALQTPLVGQNPEVHRREHSLEVQLPFLQLVAPDVPVLPMLTGTVDPIAGADVVEPLLDDETLLLVSSDLSHYHDAATARRIDAETVAAIERLEPLAIGRESACGRTGVQIALHLARRLRYRAAVLDVRNSADTAGTPDRVVGYCSVAIGG
jgi:AmmeMemoRadiSam system protein B